VWEIESIGETAGLVWNYLHLNGECSLSALERGIGAPKAMVSMAVGWLAREGKVDIKDAKRTIRISLKDAQPTG
jgi:hypothetical protein